MGGHGDYWPIKLVFSILFNVVGFLFIFQMLSLCPCSEFLVSKLFKVYKDPLGGLSDKILCLFFGWFLLFFILTSFRSDFWLFVVFGLFLEGYDSFFSEKLTFYLSLISYSGLWGASSPLTVWPLLMVSLSLGVWLGTIFRGVFTDSLKAISHSTPKGLKFVSSPFLVFIEVFSNLIRPITLGMRMTANISGGHLVVELFEEIGLSFTPLLFVGFYEGLVCFMQGVIFCILVESFFDGVK